MDRVSVEAQKPLQIRSGHTPVNIGLMVGSMIAAIPAIINQQARSHAVNTVLPTWASYVFYVVLLLGSALTLGAICRQLPTKLTATNYHVIVSRLVRERIGHYATSSILFCFSVGAFETNGMAGLSAAGWLVGISIGLLFRARQTHIDVNKLHAAMRIGDTICEDVVTDPDKKT